MSHKLNKNSDPVELIIRLMYNVDNDDINEIIDAIVGKYS